MPGFLDKLKSGADKAAFEADRLVRLNQAQAAVRSAERDLEAATVALGREALALYDAGALSQPELLATCQRIDSLRQQVASLESGVERVRLEKAPDPSAPPGEAEDEPAASQTPAVPVSKTRSCPNCGNALRSGVRFCPECGARVENA